eukprot:scaffold61023_cov36-Cyclotella_meneghiniana.AAC.2
MKEGSKWSRSWRDLDMPLKVADKYLHQSLYGWCADRGDVCLQRTNLPAPTGIQRWLTPCESNVEKDESTCSDLAFKT